MSPTALIIANWKMNLAEIYQTWGKSVCEDYNPKPGLEVIICPPSTHIAGLAHDLPSALHLGGQDCSAFDAGAYTGDVSASMLKSLGCSYVILGHSERRQGYGETNNQVKAKAQAALKAGLKPIICVGETLDQRQSGQAEAFVCDQMLSSIPEGSADQIVIAYEPIWAIGTGHTASPEDAQAMHACLRKAFPGADRDQLCLVYGGSVKPANASALFAQDNVNGALVGGASLVAQDFTDIIKSYIDVRRSSLI